MKKRNQFGLTGRIEKRIVREINKGIGPRGLIFIFEMGQFFSYCEAYDVLNPNSRRAQENAIFKIAPFVDVR